MVEKTFAEKILLSLDEIIPANVRAAILAENPDTVEVLGQKVGVEYSIHEDWSSTTFFAKARLTEALARQAVVVQNSIPTLPSGRQLTLVCEFAGQNFEASNIQELVEKIEAHRIELAWANVRQANEISNSVSEMGTVLEWLNRIYSAIEITRADNNSGEPIMAWFSLESNWGGSYFSLRLRGSLAKSQEETKASLAQLLQRSLAEVLKVPQAEPFQKSSYWSGWGLTEVGQALQARFQQILETVAGEITATNLQEKIEIVKNLAEAAKADVGGNFSSCQTLIREIEEKAKGKMQEIAYDDRRIVEGDLEQIPNLINQAKQALQSLDYDHVREYCSKASELTESLATKINQFKDEIANRRQSAVDRGEIWLDARVPVSTDSRCYTQVFCIAANGEIVPGKEERTEGRKSHLYAYSFGDLPTDHLVISHGHDNYGYCYTEWWRVDYLPKTLTYAQRIQVEELEQNRQYFVGQGTGWDLRQVGKVEFTTAYSRDMVGEELAAHEEQSRSFPIDVNEYESWQNGHDPHLPSHMVGWESNPIMVVGPYKKKVNQPSVKATPSSGAWTPVDDPRMAKKGWYICPQGHTEQIKNAEYGKKYTCGSCGHEYQIV